MYADSQVYLQAGLPRHRLVAREAPTKKEERKQMRTYELAQSLECEQPSAADMIAEAAASKAGVA
jgi:hypothetical protein